MKKLGILGGSFNPIHNGHIQLGLSALSEFKLDKVVFIPSGISYFKKDILMPPGKMRLSMVDIAIKDFDRFESSDMEITRPGDTHTYDTLLELREKFPCYELFFICGADTLYSIHKWYKADKIFDLANLIISVRNGKSFDELNATAQKFRNENNATIHFIQNENLEISSSEIRNNINNTAYLEKYLNKGVIKYIYDNDLYL